MHLRRSCRLLMATAGLAVACGAGDEPASAPAEEGPTSARAPAPSGNQPPRIAGLRFEPAEPLPGQTVRVIVEAVDPDGDTLRTAYRWRLDGEPLGDGESRVDLPETAKNLRLEVQAVVHDGRAESAPAFESLVVRNRPPVMRELELAPAGELRVTDELVATARAMDPDGDALEFEHTWSVNGRRVEEPSLTLKPRHFERGDEISIEVSVSDGEARSDPLRSSPIRVSNSAPIFVSTPTGFDAGGAFRYEPRVEDADGDRGLRYRLLEGPRGMQLDWLSGAVAWRPLPEQTGTYSVTVEVDDRHGGTSSQTFQLDVQLAPLPTAPAAPDPADDDR